MRCRGLGLGLWLVQLAVVIVPAQCLLGSDHHQYSTLAFAREPHTSPPHRNMAPPEAESFLGVLGVSPKLLEIPETWKDTLGMSGRECSMGDVLDSITGLCKSKYSQDGVDRETLAAEAEEVMKQMRGQLGMGVAKQPPLEEPAEPDEAAEAAEAAEASASKDKEMLEKLKAGSGGFARKSTQGKKNIRLHRVWV